MGRPAEEGVGERGAGVAVTHGRGGSDETGELARGVGENWAGADNGVAAGEGELPVEGFENGGLAGTIGTDDGGERAWLEGERDRAQDGVGLGVSAMEIVEGGYYGGVVLHRLPVGVG